MTTATLSRFKPAKTTVTRLDKAKVAIVTQHPFFASILMKREMICDNSIPTAGVDQRGQIYYNEKFVEGLSVDQLVFLLCHEVGHVIGQHASRRGQRTAKRWNIAGDAWINDMLKAANVGEFIPGGVDMPGSKDEFVDTIYNRLPEDEGDGDGGGDGPGGIGDDLLERGRPLTPEEADQIDAETRVAIAQAAQVAKQQGKMPGALAGIVAGLIDVPTPWYEILERYMVKFTKGEYSWARPNRRFIGQGVYLPSSGKVAEMGEVVIQVDVSGSINQKELDHYNAHLARIVEQCNPARVHVLYTDTRVCRHVVFEQGEEVQLEFYSGGGTDMEEGFNFVDKEGIEPEVFVCLTDGYFSSAASDAPSYPVVWCVSTSQTPAFGEVVRFTVS